MVSTHQRARASSRASSIDHYEPHTHQSDSKAGTKRTFSNRDSRLPLGTDQYNENGEPSSDKKRQRSSHWPLLHTSPSVPATSRSPLVNRKGLNSPSSARRPSSQAAARSSRFVEGSMHDRASQMPPRTYTGTEEELRSRFDYDNEQEDTRGRKLARPRKPTTRGSGRTGSVVGSETSRQSGIFRFGKTLASSFNPTNWKLWGKQQLPVVEDEKEVERLRVLRERKETAERMYKELKEAGKFKSGSVRGRSAGPSDSQFSTASGILTEKLDSEFETGSVRGRMSVDIYRGGMSRETSREDKRKGRVFLEPPKIFRDLRDESPASVAGSFATSAIETPSKQSLHVKKPSLSSIKNAFSSSNDLVAVARPRISSKKELEKQQKLVKRVSDLESKLDVARRQLSESIQEATPTRPASKIGRSRFVPGALASLPSERLLAGYVNSDAGFEDDDSQVSIGKALTVDFTKDEESEQGFVGPAPTPSWLGGRLEQQDRLVHTVERDESVQGMAASEVGRETVVSMVSGLSEPSTGFVNDPEDDDFVQGESEEEFPMRYSTKRKRAKKPSPKKASPKKPFPKSSLSKDLPPTKKTSAKKPSPQINTPKDTPPTEEPAKKRKSTTFEGYAYDGGEYEPTGDTDSESEPETEVIEVTEIIGATKVTPRKNNNAGRPRKLQKTLQDSNGDLKPNTKNAGPGKAPARPPPSVPGREDSLKIVKKRASPPPSQNPNPPQNGSAKQSFSPPPSSAFTGLEYTKPSLTREKQPQALPQKQTIKSVGGPLAGNREDSFYTADPTTDDTVPPVPNIPKEVRLPSGEVIQTQSQMKSKAGSKAGSNVSRASKNGKLTKSRPAAKEKERVREKNLESEGFDWDKDTF